MAGSVNKVILIGNLGADPEVRRTQDGRPVVNLRLATSNSWKDKTTGERREKTEWHRVVIFNENLCRIAEQYLKKGSKVFIEGALQTRKWQDQSGQDRYSTEVVLQGFRGELTLLDRAGGAGGAGAGAAGAAAMSAPMRQAASSGHPDRRARSPPPHRPAAEQAPTWTTKFRSDVRPSPGGLRPPFMIKNADAKHRLWNEATPRGGVISEDFTAPRCLSSLRCLASTLPFQGRAFSFARK